ncbi:CRISPR-associated endoribonuclease Cas6 [Halonotius pteroides]|uniref:CRISPR-associated endoribonuclease Cas6 n=1 Tax=Halonotius pteroides TaxID=268735 RepID=A0A3A6Q8D0_9EURY|nr:CRISPR-associated endoribonuclease Cas6 [Halonotius pteroides]RJX47999.1 CRISPR-associated endoribonuclease Cas6 [Halonotius pteroides]
MVHLSARSDAAYQNDYHHKLRGRIWNALEDTPYDDRHDNGEPPGFAYSNPFPPHDMEAGDDRKLLVSSPDEELLANVAADLLDDRELNIGEMPFHVDDVSSLEPDVGEPGTEGTIESGTGVLVRIPQWKADDYGIKPDGDEAIFWQPEHTMEPFITQVENNLDQKHNRFCPDYLPGPSDTDYELFDSYELIKTFAIPVTVTTGQEMTYVLSKWRFEYQVRDDDHRRHLNLALDTGIGERNGLGLGFLNITNV